MTKRGLFGLLAGAFAAPLFPRVAAAAGMSPLVQLRAREMILPERIAMALRESNQTVIHRTGRFDFVPYGSLDPEPFA